MRAGEDAHGARDLDAFEAGGEPPARRDVPACGVAVAIEEHAAAVVVGSAAREGAGDEGIAPALALPERLPGSVEAGGVLAASLSAAEAVAGVATRAELRLGLGVVEGEVAVREGVGGIAAKAPVSGRVGGVGVAARGVVAACAVASAVT